MWSLHRVVTWFAVGTAASLRAHSLPATTSVAVDVLHAVEESVDRIGDKSAYVAAAHDIHSESDADLEAGISNAADWRSFTEVPVTGIIKTNEGSSVFHLSGAYPTDRRVVKGDEHYHIAGSSYYISTCIFDYKPVVLLFDVDGDGLLLQAVECVRSSPARPSGMFLAAHSVYDSDTKYPGYLRLFVQDNADWAIIWQVVKEEGKKYLRVKKNRFPKASATAGWYLAVPPDGQRDAYSNYLAITPDAEKAMAVTFEEYNDDSSE